MATKEATFQMRFAAKRLHGVVGKNMNIAKRAIIAKTPFKDLLHVSPFAAPMELIEFVAMNTNAKLREFRFKGKSILFTRDMVVKVLGVPSGDRPMEFLKRSQQSDLRDMFKNEKGRTTLARAIEVLEHCDDTNEDLVVQSFGLIAFATVLCPGTGNTVKCEYLGSLMDRDAIGQYAIDEHILSEVMGEVEVFQDKIRRRSELDSTQTVWIGQCLPMLATIYMDFLSFPTLGPKEHIIQKYTPRFLFVCDADFHLVVSIDKNKMSLNPSAFGNRPLLPLSKTLYAAIAPANASTHVEPVIESDAAMGSQDVEVNLSASLNDWLDKGLASSQELEVPEHLQVLYNKHKDLYAAEVDVALDNFGQFMKALQAKRMERLLADVHAANVASSSFTIPCPMSSTHPKAADAPLGVKEARQPNVTKKFAKNTSKVQKKAVVQNVVIDGDKARKEARQLKVPSKVHKEAVVHKEATPVPSSVPGLETIGAASTTASTEASREAVPPTVASPVAAPAPSPVASPVATAAPPAVASPVAAPAPSPVVTAAPPTVASPVIAPDPAPAAAPPTVASPVIAPVAARVVTAAPVAAQCSEDMSLGPRQFKLIA